MMVDLVWTTKDEYIASVKEVTDVWYIAGSDYLAPLVNSAMIERINGFEPENLRRGAWTSRQALACAVRGHDEGAQRAPAR